MFDNSELQIIFLDDLSLITWHTALVLLLTLQIFGLYVKICPSPLDVKTLKHPWYLEKWKNWVESIQTMDYISGSTVGKSWNTYINTKIR